jgi:aryl-alcohol dehydrogenase-like predicted oxidoreductase
MKLALGTANFGQIYGLSKKNINLKKKIKNILETSNKLNINLVDTSVNYGSAEKLLGKNDLKKFKVVSKLNLSKNTFKRKTNIEKLIFKTVEKSLINLNINKLHGILLHNVDDLKNNKRLLIIQTLRKLKKLKLVSKIGVSIYEPKDLDYIWTFWKPDIIQCPFNILDQRIYKSGWMSKLKKNKIEIYARSVFLQGLLLKNTNDIPKKFHKWKKFITKFINYCKKSKISQLEACINFTKSFKDLSYVVIGFENLNQIKQSVKIFNNSNNNKIVSFECNEKKLIDPRLW